MKESLLPLLSCPRCRSDGLSLRPDRRRDGEIVDGEISCSGCGRSYPIRDGIPLLLPEPSAGETATARAFGYAWLTHPIEFAYSEEQFLDWIEPFQPRDFDGKTVLDAGCGTGNFARYVAAFGGEVVVAMDLSESVHVAQPFAERRTGLHVVRGDLVHPPLRPVFDFIYSIGVLHHIDDTRTGIEALRRLLKPGGTFFVWVYGAENNGLIARWIDPPRSRIAKILPPGIMKWLVAFPATVPLWIVLLGLYRPIDRVPALRGCERWFPYAAYFRWLSRGSFQVVLQVVFDHLVAPVSRYISREEITAWMESAGLEDVRTTWRNRNSWRAWGRAPASP